MADLSDLLGDVYGESTPKSTPAWADESRLDEVFSDWEPEPRDPVLGDDDITASSEPWAVDWPGEDEAGAEPELVTPATPSGQLLDDDLAAALSAALAEAPRPEPLVVPAPVPAGPMYLPFADDEDETVLDLGTLEPFVEPVEIEEPAAEIRPWRREDDDIVPGRGGKGGRLSFRLR